jgi:hypothetical protein
MVDDITQEADVELIVDIHRPPQFTEVPQPIMTDRHNLTELCKSYEWKYCTRAGEEADRTKLYYTCEVRLATGLPSAFIMFVSLLNALS